MSANSAFASIHDSAVAQSAAYPKSHNPTPTSGYEGRSVPRSPSQLRQHRALLDLGGAAVMNEFNDAARMANTSAVEPILITTDGTILAGFGRWWSALVSGLPEVNCIAYPFDEDESLQFIVAYHQARRGWNDFVRIRLALTLESSLQQKAINNMRMGGKFKGPANLPDPHIDVRHEIARAAGVGDRNVSNVRTILNAAHPRLIEALQEGTLSINRAIQLCELPKMAQLEQFICYSEERATNKVIRRSIAQPKAKTVDLPVLAMLKGLHNQEERRPGSVAMRMFRRKDTIVLLVKDLSAVLPSQSELNLI